MKYLLSIYLFLIITGGLNAQSRSREEFNRPFASWANVKTRFNAKGDGNYHV